MTARSRSLAVVAALALAFSMVAADHADARRGGSFGSRGTRTFQQAPATRTVPQAPAPIQRTTTPDAGPTVRQPNATSPASRGFGGGFLGGGLARGLLLGGLFGLLLGHGFGGMAGFLGLLVQGLLIAGVVWLLFRLFSGARGAAPRPAYAGAGNANPNGRQAFSGVSRVGPAANGFGASAAPATSPLTLSQGDLDTFERRLGELQTAYSGENFDVLRRIATPEVSSYLSAELTENAREGVVNEVSDVRLLQADIAESWRERDADYATAALRYSSRDIRRDRKTGQVVAGDPEPTEATELWTFRRPRNGEWQVSAIQEA